jgi:hypothetical protein
MPFDQRALGRRSVRQRLLQRRVGGGERRLANPGEVRVQRLGVARPGGPDGRQRGAQAGED